MGRSAPVEPVPDVDAGELDDVARRVEEALNTARTRIESNISAANATKSSAHAAYQSGAGRRLGRGDKWQRDDNVFNEVSRAVNARARGTLHDIRFSMSTRISWNYTRILWETLVISLVLLAVVYGLAALPQLEAVSADAAAQVADAARALPGGLAALPEPTPAPSAEPTAASDAAQTSGQTLGLEQSASSVLAAGSEQSAGSVPAAGPEQSDASVPVAGSEQSAASAPTPGSEQSAGSVPAAGSEQSEASVPAAGSEQSEASVPVAGSEQSAASVPAAGSEQSEASVPAAGSEQSAEYESTFGSAQPISSAPTPGPEQSAPLEQTPGSGPIPGTELASAPRQTESSEATPAPESAFAPERLASGADMAGAQLASEAGMAGMQLASDAIANGVQAETSDAEGGEQAANMDEQSSENPMDGQAVTTDGQAVDELDAMATGPEPTREPVRLIDLRLGGADHAYARVSGIDGRVYYDDAPFELTTASVLSYWDGEFYRVDSLLVNVDGYVYQVYVAAALTYWLRLCMIMLGGVALVDLFRGLYFLIKGRAINAQMLGPIGEISETARALNAQNMSQRINVEGTRSELRELALVINEMLDRIEAAYDGQKQFVSDASHELRTPIAVIQGYATMLQRWGKDDAAVRDEAITAISSEAANMKDLVEKLLFLARHDRQTLKLNPELIDMRELTESIARETRMIAPDHEIICGEMQDVRVLGDGTALKQALRIFMDNACKYTPAGGKVTISCVQGGMGALISVEDTGCGIPAGELKRVFDRFYRVDGSRGAVPGHGLGLSIARIIAVRHGGRIHVRSKEGVGSVFTLELPGIA